MQKTAGYTVAFSYDSLDRPAQRGTSKFGYHDLTNTPVLSPTALGEAKLLRDPAGTAIAAKNGSAAGALLLDDVLHTDINAVTDPTTGDLVASTSYDPWGAPTATTGILPPIGYQTGYTDPDTGFVNAHARWYDPALGVFTSRDTWNLDPDPLPQANRYLYANGDPLTGTDPDGHMRPPPRADEGGGTFGQCSTTCVTMIRTAPAFGNQPKRKNAVTILRTTADEVCINSACMNRKDVKDVAGLAGTAATVAWIHNPNFVSNTKLGDSLILTNACGEVRAAEMNKQHAGSALCSSDLWHELDRTVAIEQLNIQAATGSALAQFQLDKEHIDYINDILEIPSGGGVDVGTPPKAGTPVLRFGNNTSSGPTTEHQPKLEATSTSQITSRGCRNSFDAQTPVLMADGTTKEIESVTVGDRVAATDPSQDTTTAQTVTAYHRNVDDDLVDLTVTTSNGSAAVLHTTQHHPVWDETDKAWVDAADLEPGHQLRAQDGTAATVDAVTPVSGTKTMFNLTVADIHTYYVVAGMTPVLVHNDGGSGRGGNIGLGEGYTGRARLL